MAGSTDELLDHLNRDWEARCQLLDSQPQKNQDESLVKTLKFLQKHAETRDIHILLDDERVMIRHALEYDVNSPEEAQSLKTASAQLDEAAKCLNVVCNDHQGYKAGSETYSIKRREAGLPLDAFREFLKSHTARLSNRLAGKCSHSEKLIFRQRKENLSVIRECYVELQRKALGLPPAEQHLGLGR